MRKAFLAVKVALTEATHLYNGGSGSCLAAGADQMERAGMRPADLIEDPGCADRQNHPAARDGGVPGGKPLV